MAAPAFTTVTDGLAFPEGPVALADGSVLVVEIRRGTLTRVEPDGTKAVVAELGGGPNGAAIGPDGAVYICNNGGFAWLEQGGLTIPVGKAGDHKSGSIQRVDLRTGDVTTLYENCDGEPLRGPNDIVFNASGGFWFTDHGHADHKGRDHGRIFYARPDGSNIIEVKRELISPNGIGLSPDGATLYVSETFTSRLWAFDVVGPGKLGPGPNVWQPGHLMAAMTSYRLFDSLAVEADGAVCIGSMVEGGITVVDGRITTAEANGSHVFVPLPDIGITNICFGGRELRTAWVTASTTGTLLRLDWPRPGLRLAFNA